MKSFVKFGVLMALLFVFILPAVFPVSEGDGNPSIKSANENLVTEDVLKSEERDIESNEQNQTLVYNPLLYVGAVDNWVTVQDIETTVNEQKPHTAFNPIAREELSKNTNTKGNKWVAIRGADECDAEKVQNEEQNDPEEINKQSTLFVPEKSSDLRFGFDEDNIRTLPAYPTKGDREVVVNI